MSDSTELAEVSLLRLLRDFCGLQMNREEKDPHDIHKMPVQTGAFQKSVAVRTKLSSSALKSVADQQQDADKNVACHEIP